jgi:hypothetical protein
LALFMSEKQKDVMVRRQKEKFAADTGKKIGMQRRVFAEFRRGGVPDWALPLAEQTFTMNGKSPEIPARMWLCTYDSELDQASRNWTDEERKLIEDNLREQNGVVEISPPQVPAPWPAYDKLVVHGQRKIEHVIAKIKEKIEEDEYDPQRVLAYERQELRRPEVVAALEALIRENEPEPEGVIAA